MPTVYVTIGNSDDKLAQGDWSTFWGAVDDAVRLAAIAVHGAWVSESTSPYQNACWCIEVDAERQWLRDRLANMARAYEQDAIAWAETSNVEFLNGRAVSDA